MYSVFSSPHIFSVFSPTAIKLFSFTLKFFHRLIKIKIFSSALIYTDIILTIYRNSSLLFYVYVSTLVLLYNAHIYLVHEFWCRWICTHWIYSNDFTHIFAGSSFSPKKDSTCCLHYVFFFCCIQLKLMNQNFVEYLSLTKFYGVFVCNDSSYLTASV